jgi:hypothetical protein
VSIGRISYTIVIDRLHAGSETPCLRCGQRFVLGVAALTMKVGTEVLGYFASPACRPPCVTS